jgi:predicted cupin superfamily sugar epimerase
MSELSAADVICLLGLKPHPEGGHFRETFRDERADGGRAASTAIYFLLAAGEASHWHRVDAVEVWHWHAGAPDNAPTRIRLGNDLAGGERPQAVVPAGHWQSARSLGAGRWWGARSRPASTSLDSSLRRRDSSRPFRCNAKMLQEGRKSDFSTTNEPAAFL